MYLLGVLTDPANADQKYPVIFTGPASSADYFESLDQLITVTLGEDVRRFYRIVIDDAPGAAQWIGRKIRKVQGQRRTSGDAYYFNWLLKVPIASQMPFHVTHESVAALRLRRDMSRHELAVNLRRAFSAIVTGNVKDHGIRMIREHGPFVLHGDRDIMEVLEKVLGEFVAQGRMKLPGARYQSCFRLAARSMTSRGSQPAWLARAVFYQIYPQSFFDANGDGIGDLAGIEAKLDYLADLGVNALWINPCFVSPFKDAGYDVADHCRIAPRYGTNDQFKALLDAAHERDIRVCLDLVAGHTSDQHPWFVAFATRGAERVHRPLRVDEQSVGEARRRTRLHQRQLRSRRRVRGELLRASTGVELRLRRRLTRGYQQDVDAPGPRATRAALKADHEVLARSRRGRLSRRPRRQSRQTRSANTSASAGCGARFARGSTTTIAIAC